MNDEQILAALEAAGFEFGSRRDDTIEGGPGDQTIFGFQGNDRLFGGEGFDNLYGNADNDRLFGGLGNDNLYGGEGRDVLHGDSGLSTVKGSDLGSDNLDGGRWNDALYVGDGNDTLTGGRGEDTFNFKWQDPMVALALGTGRAFATLTDFDPDQDTLTFDVAGLGRDAEGANFIDGGDGTAGSEASSFFKGNARNSDGESVMILDRTGFATGADAVVAAQNEEMGDFVMYFNTTANIASLLFVDAPDTAHSIARFANITSVDDLREADFTAGDFLYV